MAETLIPEKAEEAIFTPPTQTVTIGDREFTLRPLNLFGFKAAFGFAARTQNAFTTAFKTYTEARDNALLNDGPTPEAAWWLPVLLDNLDAALELVLVILRRDDKTVTIQWLEENFEPLTSGSDLFAIVIRQNRLEDVIKKVLASQLGQLAQGYLASRINSDLRRSAATSPGTTESPSTTLPPSIADTPSSSASTSGTESPVTSAS